MRHATVAAIQLVLGIQDDAYLDWDAAALRWRMSLGHSGSAWVVACDWTAVNYAVPAFWLRDAMTLLTGGSPVELPSCPHCAYLVDLALSIRAAEHTSRVEAELDAERKEAAG